MIRLSQIHPWAALGVAFVSINIAAGVLILAGDLPRYAPLIGAAALVLGLGALLVAVRNRPAS